MEKSPSREKDNKKKLSSFLPKALIEELNKNLVDKNTTQNSKSSFPLKEKDINLKTNPSMNSSINHNHSFHPLNGKNFNFTNGSYKTQNIPPQFQYNGFNSNDIEKDGYYNGNNFNINTENDLINYINIKRYLNKLNHMNGINGMNGTNGINVTNGINGINGINVTNGINGINGINGLNGHIYKNGNLNKNGIHQNGNLFKNDGTNLFTKFSYLVFII